MLIGFRVLYGVKGLGEQGGLSVGKGIRVWALRFFWGLGHRQSMVEGF